MGRCAAEMQAAKPSLLETLELLICKGMYSDEPYIVSDNIQH